MGDMDQAASRGGLSMEYKEQISYLRYLEQQAQHIEASAFGMAARSITDLLARAEAAEADNERLREALKINCLLCESMHPDNGNCTEVGGFCTAVPAAHCPLIPRLRARAEKAEMERDAAVKIAQENDICYRA